MKKLPKYFIIKRDNNNPLWKQYLNWLNETYHRNWLGMGFNYYGVDNKNTYACTIAQEFTEYSTLITLEEWNECVNGKPKYTIAQIKEQNLTVNCHSYEEGDKICNALNLSFARTYWDDINKSNWKELNSFLFLKFMMVL